MFSLIRSSNFDRDLFRFPQFVSQLLDDSPANGSVPTLTTRVDVLETDSSYLVSAECPGLDRETLNVTVEAGVLSISGSKKNPWADKSQGLHLSERSFGEFSRTFRLPREVDTTQVKAEYIDGILQLTLPKSAAAQPVKITVK